MKTIQNMNRIGMCLSAVILAFGCVDAWAVVPYPLPADLAKAETVRSEKQEILKRIKYLKRLDISVIKEIENDLKKMEEKERDPLPKGGPRAERP